MVLASSILATGFKSKSMFKIIIAIAFFAGLVSFTSSPTPGETIAGFDFGESKSGADWRIMNDGVMGGLSEGDATLTEQSLILKGQISLANNGGFSSVRSPWNKTDISEAKNATLRYRSTGQLVSLCLEPNRRWWLPYYLIDLKPTQGEWQTVSIPILNAKEYAWARPTGNNIETEQLGKILRIGFMTNDKKESSFEFEVDYLRFE